MKSKPSYLSLVRTALKATLTGLRLTLSHFKKSTSQAEPVNIKEDNYFKNFEKGLQTIQYPHESLPVPDNGRYRLHNEIDDCIVCDKCAKVCPVNCIDIEAIKDTEVYGHTSDGTPKRIHAAKFDINMAQCCFCGLCTTVCPTECLTMTKTFDFSEYDFEDHIYAFANLSDEDKKLLTEKKEEKSTSVSSSGSTGVKKKPSFKPKISPKKDG